MNISWAEMELQRYVSNLKAESQRDLLEFLLPSDPHLSGPEAQTALMASIKLQRALLHKAIKAEAPRQAIRRRA